MQIVKLQINTYGKHSKYGDNIYQVGQGADMLIAAGWKVGYKPRGQTPYCYLTPPEGEGCKRPTVTVAIPDEEEIKALACELHEARAEVQTSLYHWPVHYAPAHTKVMQSTRMKLTADGLIEETPRESVRHYAASFEIGVSVVWSAVFHWSTEGGADARPYRLLDENIVGDADPNATPIEPFDFRVERFADTWGVPNGLVTSRGPAV